MIYNCMKITVPGELKIEIEDTTSTAREQQNIQTFTVTHTEFFSVRTVGAFTHRIIPELLVATNR